MRAKLLLIAASLWCAALLAAETNEAPSLESAREEIGRLLPLGIRKDQLVLLEEAWPRGTVEKPLDERPPVSLFWDVAKKLCGERFQRKSTKIEKNADGDGAPEKTVWSFDTDVWHGELKLSDDDFDLHVFLKSNPKIRIVYSQHEKDLVVDLVDIVIQPKENRQVHYSNFDNAGARLTTTPDKGFDVQIGEANFNFLMRIHPDKVQLGLLKPLAAVGVEVEQNRFLPAVMAVATSGYCDSPAEIGEKVDALIGRLSLDDSKERDMAQFELIKLFPMAMAKIEKAAATANDPETKSRLQKVMAAHPMMAKARAYVEKEKLHENREYLAELIATVPFFKAQAEARLKLLNDKP